MANFSTCNIFSLRKYIVKRYSKDSKYADIMSTKAT